MLGDLDVAGGVHRQQFEVAGHRVDGIVQDDDELLVRAVVGAGQDGTGVRPHLHLMAPVLDGHTGGKLLGRRIRGRDVEGVAGLRERQAGNGGREVEVRQDTVGVCGAALVQPGGPVVGQGDGLVCSNLRSRFSCKAGNHAVLSDLCHDLIVLCTNRTGSIGVKWGCTVATKIAIDGVVTGCHIPDCQSRCFDSLV